MEMWVKPNISSQRVDIITRSMHFTDAESAAFWPVFKKYEADLEKLTDEKAKDLTQKNITIEEKRARLKGLLRAVRKSDVREDSRKIYAGDNHVDLLVNLQLVEQIPLVN